VDDLPLEQIPLLITQLEGMGQKNQRTDGRAGGSGWDWTDAITLTIPHLTAEGFFELCQANQDLQLECVCDGRDHRHAPNIPLDKSKTLV